MDTIQIIFRKISKHSGKGFALVLSFILTGISIRWYEYIIVSSNTTLPDNALLIYLKAALTDLFLLSFIGTLFLFLWIILDRYSLKWMKKLIAGLMILFFIIYISVVQYFGEVLVLLGVDFWAYNLSEISDTVNTSVDFSFARIAPFILFSGFFLILNFLLTRINFSERLKQTGVISLILLSIAHFFFSPNKSDFEIELMYSISANKASHFISESAGLLLNDVSVHDYSGPEYPLMTPSGKKDVLGSFFNKIERPPNLVFIIVEGLGGTLVPPNASHGGFTPFLDSLAAESLYWTHFLSTSGRSFNAQPSIFGSLPYGQQGFMDLGINMPEHHTLISILNDNGYQTNYFGGYDTSFDKLDQFLERQSIDLLINSSHFPETYQKMDEIEGGFTWGYSDQDLYKYAFEYVDKFNNEQPRLDIYFSLNFHEPFIINNTQFYHEAFQSRLTALDIPDDRKELYKQYTALFSALLYTDEAIKQLITQYKKRADFEETIFIITGDHRMVPVPHRDRIDRYYVPFMIYSPMLKESKQFKSLASHLDIAPSLSAYLSENYNIRLPEFVHWMSEGLSTDTSFISNKKIPLMRTKNRIDDYLSGEYYLSGDQLFKLYEGMVIGSYDDPELKKEIRQELNAFLELNNYVTYENKLLKLTEEQRKERKQIDQELAFLDKHNLQKLNDLELYFAARDSAFNLNYQSAQILLRHILRKQPNFHDARILYGRTFAWDGNYEQANIHINEVLRRAPNVMDAYTALTDLYYWQEEHEKSLEHAKMGLSKDRSYIPLVYRKARSFYLLGKIDSAKLWVNKGLSMEPDNTNLNDLQVQLSGN